MSRLIRCVVVDDEPLARKLLRSMLGEHSDVDVVAECESGDEAVAVLERERPDVVFLDIQMPKLSGLDVVAHLGPESRTEVVFVTAFDRYAVDAFDLNAVDYLLKPFDEERLAETLDRVRRRLGSRGPGYSDRLLALVERLGTREELLQRIAVRRGERISLQPVDAIELFESEGKYVRLHTSDGEEHVIRETMIELVRRLDAKRFVRISRSSIINVDEIREIQPWFRGDFIVILKSGRKVQTTKSFRGPLKELIDRG